jgi:hypothetical protein
VLEQVADLFTQRCPTGFPEFQNRSSLAAQVFGQAGDLRGLPGSLAALERNKSTRQAHGWAALAGVVARPVLKAALSR